MDAVEVRLSDLARRVNDIEGELRANRPVVLARELESQDEDMRALTAEVKGLRRAVMGFALTVAGSAVAFALTVIIVWGTP